MNLLTKFNLILVLLFGTGLLLVSRYAKDFLVENARQQVVQQAELMVESAQATRSYTVQELKPLLDKLPEQTEFVRQTVPAYAATETFNRLRKEFPDYSYKEATLNPTNPRDRAIDWEADVINYFRNNPTQTEFIGERDTPTGRSLYLAHPLPAKKACLVCHSVPEAAPASMIRTYGTGNGFGWGENEIVAAQIVSVPMSLPVGIADKAYKRLLIYLVVIFFATLAAVDLLLVFIVIRPVQKLAQNADRLSKGDLDTPQLGVHGKDEISALTASFNRMDVSLRKALTMIAEEE
jgi:HAMP domain-containing protein